MALIKIGMNYPNGNEVPVYMVVGNAVRDGEVKPINGKDHAKVSVAAKEMQDGTTMFIGVNGWRSKAADVAAIRKMDTVLAVGTLKSSEYNGRKFYDLDADFVCISGVGRLRVPPSVRPSAAVDVSADDFDELPDEDAGELPF